MGSARFRILSLDGGGAKGMYTLGVLAQLERTISQRHAKDRLCHHFDLVYGTSTGAIIAMLIGLGWTVEQITALYVELIPYIMKKRNAGKRSAALLAYAQQRLAMHTPQDFKTLVGIVAMRRDSRRPMIFKSDARIAHGNGANFVPLFGASLCDVLLASCAAAPFFREHVVQLADQARVPSLDGGFVANNPTLYALTDAICILRRPPEQVYCLNVGVGQFREPRFGLIREFVRRTFVVRLLETVLDANAASMDHLADSIFPTVHRVRISQTHDSIRTHMLEADSEKLKQLYAFGVESFATASHTLETWP